MARLGGVTAVIFLILCAPAGGGEVSFRDTPEFQRVFKDSIKKGQTEKHVRKLLGEPSRVRSPFRYEAAFIPREGLIFSYEVEYDADGKVDGIQIFLDSDAAHKATPRSWPDLRQTHRDAILE